ncbi:MAG TPA: hypothetical protein PKY83_05005 [Bacteroidales bacterium]|jgi:hypothetical protein|nr:hypothetical protein [Bacteroidales bacterium]MCZ2416224.1 hypothetical protein [Burkholderiales bacterium]OQC56994.1 MAG: hypothetical protein BWX52_01321 [Bacteroidetes bacterium ADurb.Bin013]MBP8999594.1 hypothetical protein [Bacteroidales bacterium]MBV6456248.1 hypothetical protein [Bacteroidales bacterium]
MKKLFFLIAVAACLLPLSAGKLAAQYHTYDYITYDKHEVFLQYGAPTFQELSTQIRKVTIVARDGNKYVPDRFVYTGIAALGYNYYTSPYMSLGGYVGISAAMMEMAKTGTQTAVFKSSVLSITGLVTAHWIYYRTGMWELSAHAAAGITRWIDEQEMIVSGSSDISTDTRKWRFAYHLSPLRVRWGGSFGVFADIGLGYKGIANAGVSVRF